MQLNVSRGMLAGLLLLVAAASAVAQARIDVEAAAGEPFGVGRLTIELPRGARLAAQAGDGLSLTAAADRVLYPGYETTSAGPIRGLLREVVPARRRTVYFLFRGADPLDLTAYAGASYQTRAVPRSDAALHARLLSEWWRRYTAFARRTIESAKYAPIVENFLVESLSRRLQLELPASAAPSGPWAQAQGALGLLAGTEGNRLNIQRQLLRGRRAAEQADQPLPRLSLPTLVVPKPPGEVAIEPIALRVPEECFYLRCGSFANFQWLRERLDQWGGDARNLVAQRSVDLGLSKKLERQIALRESALSKLLGPAVIADVAIMGSDTFVREGAAMGILFQARNNLALSSDFNRQRQEAVAREAGAKQEKLTVAGREVSLIATPDGALRSYYAIDGDYHLVTTSRALVERFLATGKGTGSVGSLPAFKHARSIMPLDRDDALFIYVSDAMLRNLAGPRYQIEMRRRAESAAEMELVELARLCAAAEGGAARSPRELVEAGYLPPGFGERADGSKLVLDGPAPVDSLRGPKGAFVPVPDVELRGVTPSEARQYAEFADLLASQWGEFGPVLVGIRRQNSGKPGIERLTIDAHLPQIASQQQQLLSRWIGPASDRKLAPIAGDVAAFQASLAGGNSLGGGPPYQLFGALRDADPTIARNASIMDLVGPLLGLENVQGYLGAWPHAGLLRPLSAIGGRGADAAGYARLLGGLSQREVGQFTVLSFQPDVLAQVTPQLRFEQPPRPAQAWIHAGDVSASNVAGFVNTWGYRQARSLSEGNSRLLTTLSEQLHVPRERCLATAEQLLQAKLVCPLGGQYELQARADAPGAWTSTAWRPSRPLDRGVPADYRFPALDWIRGLEAELLMREQSLEFHAQIDMPASLTASPDKTAPPQPKPPASSGPKEF